MSKTKTFTTIVCAITLFFLFCSKNPVDHQTAENNGGQARFLLVASAESDFSVLAHHAEAKVSAPDMDSITQELEVDSLSVSGIISDIPAGFNRKFEVTVYTDSNTVCYYGKAYMDIIAGITNNVPLTLYRYSGTGDANINGTIVDSIPSDTNIQPTVEITSPENGSQFITGDSIEITAAASDTDGEITSVSFYNGSDLLENVTETPYTYTITDAEAGSYSFVCVAYDNSGDSAVSDTVKVTVSDSVNIPPTVEITAPEDGAEFNAGESIEITASASDEDGIISGVSFFNGSDLLENVTETPYTYTITDAEAGSYSFVCVAYDNSGDSAVSDTVKVTVSDSVNIPPTVQITAPEDGAEFNAGESIEITASASDEDGTITSISFYNGDELLDEVTEAPYAYTITDAEAGSYSLSCVAYDNSGDSAISETVNVTVKSGSDLLAKYGVPTADPFSSIVRNFTSIVTEGTDAPSMSQVKEVRLNWDLPNNGLWDFGMNTSDGNPDWYIRLIDKIEHTFADNNPGCTISGSGFDGFDGEYYITMDGDNMVLVEKTGQHAVIFQP